MKKCTIEYEVKNTCLISLTMPDAIDPLTLDNDSILHMIYDAEDKDDESIEVVNAVYTVNKVYPDDTGSDMEDIGDSADRAIRLTAEDAYDLLFNADARFENVDDDAEVEDEDNIVYLPQWPKP